MQVRFGFGSAIASHSASLDGTLVISKALLHLRIAMLAGVVGFGSTIASHGASLYGTLGISKALLHLGMAMLAGVVDSFLALARELLGLLLRRFAGRRSP